jgi:hypothetical protein
MREAGRLSKYGQRFTISFTIAAGVSVQLGLVSCEACVSIRLSIFAVPRDYSLQGRKKTSEISKKKLEKTLRNFFIDLHGHYK